jgi:hypothetical protein
MIQTATFPDLESLPNVSTQAILYFSSTIGTLTEVDVVTSGSFNTQFHGENLGSSSSTIEGTTTANLSFNVPSGAIPLTIPSVTESFNALAYDGILNYMAPSGREFAPVTSNSASQTRILTSPAELAAFTGNFRMPISVSGHATGSATSSNGNLSAGFETQTSATISVIYHFIPNLPSLDPTGSPGLQAASVPGSQAPGVPGSAVGTASSGNAAPSDTSPAASAPTPPSVTFSGEVKFVRHESAHAHHSANHGRERHVGAAAILSYKSGHHASRDRIRSNARGHVRGLE